MILIWMYLVGTVTEDIANIVRTSKSSFDFKADKHGVLHTGIGKVSFDAADLEGIHIIERTRIGY